jgi:hypothetical protein
MDGMRARRWSLGGFPAALALLATVAGCGDDVTPTTTAASESLEFGSAVNPEEFAKAAGALPPEALADPPGSLPAPGASSTLEFLPAIATQGTPATLGVPGTCEAQSFGYGLGSYTAARGADGFSIKWDPGQPGNAVSAAYQFALAVSDGFATCPKGGTATQYLGRLASFGSPTAADVQYQPSCDYFAGISLGKAYPDAPRLRIGSFATFEVGTSQSLALIRQFLANKQAVAFSGLVYKGYGNPSGPALTDGYFYAAPDLPTGGGHGQLLVGYDNAKGAAGQAPGVLLVQNSFSPAWPATSSGSKAPPGMLYWSYETFLRTQKLAAVAYPYDPSPPKGALLAASDPQAPVASIERAYQWAPIGASAAYLILVHHSADPVRVMNVALKEPAPGTVTAAGGLGQFLSKGYTYLRRTDGSAFLPGRYAVTVKAQTLAGASVTYTGTVDVAGPLPATPPAASMTSAASAGKLFDSLGGAPQIATGP